MRAVHTAVVAYFVLGASLAHAGGTVLFDFDAVPERRGDFAISDYMTEAYGSTVSTDGARSVGEASGAADIFIATSLQLLGRGDFVIEFADVPIIGAQFEGHVIDATSSEDFRFRGFHGDVEVFSFSRNVGEETFQSGWLAFDEPVDRIILSDSGRRDVGIDDFLVQPVPDPATGLLVLAGVCAALTRRRR